MTKSIFIDGAAGTTGLEIADRLSGRDEFALIALDDAKRKDPAAKREALNEADFVILCLPDDAAKEAVAMTTSATTRIIDEMRVAINILSFMYEFRHIIHGCTLGLMM